VGDTFQLTQTEDRAITGTWPKNADGTAKTLGATVLVEFADPDDPATVVASATSWTTDVDEFSITPPAALDSIDIGSSGVKTLLAEITEGAAGSFDIVQFTLILKQQIG